ncbi:MAG: hypothetical protein V4628_14860 [Pseudomonadota bacterium]
MKKHQYKHGNSANGPSDLSGQNVAPAEVAALQLMSLPSGSMHRLLVTFNRGEGGLPCPAFDAEREPERAKHQVTEEFVKEFKKWAGIARN